MTLRIPDDEVSRPQLPATTPMGGIPIANVHPSRPPSNPELGRGSRPPSAPDYAAPPPVPSTPPPMRADNMLADDTLELPAVDLHARGATLGGRAPGVDASHEVGWTPFQPAVSPRTDFGDERIVTRGHDAAAVAAQAAMRDPAHTMIDEPGGGAIGMMMQDARAREEAAREETPSVPPISASEDIPIDTDDEEEALVTDRSDELTTNPRLQAAAASSEEIKIDDGERLTDPGEVPDEIAPEDLVSVESIPNPHSPHAPPPLKSAPKPGAPHVTATALMSGVGPTGGGVLTPAIPAPLAMPVTVTPILPVAPIAPTPVAPPVAVKAPSIPPATAVPSYVPAIAQAPAVVPPQQHQHAPPAHHVPQSAPQAHTSQAPPVHQHAPQSGQPQPQHVPPSHPQAHPQAPQPQAPPPPALTLQLQDATPAAGTPMARRPQPTGGPFGFMPQVGALAPPPMNEAAANRKKTRPWWEDLFNDDFIRTMAKITDADIAREANFIEESLGCEAGATILDLACGTGRHAVELASRGYQVVGFDLSLAMLARASDEAQDRKQKINFVQGDMREMTFEETFDGVFSWNTSFGFFDEEKNATVIAKVHRALKKGGQFLLDVVNRDNLIRSAPSLAWFEGDGCICMDEMQIDFITSRMRVKRTLMMDDGRTKEIEYSIRVYSLHELGKMLHDNGFRVAEVSGRTGTPGVFFGCESPRTLILAEKR
jgi:SAM-dependent methyltransferase